MVEVNLWGVLVALGIGFLIGLEREREIQKQTIKDFIGIRTFTLIALIGAISGWAYLSQVTWIPALAFASVIILIALHHASGALKKGKEGLTTEFAVIGVFLLAFMSLLASPQLALAGGIILLAFLEFKQPLHQFARTIKSEEVNAAIKFAIITALILPFLPNVDYSPNNIPGVATIISSAGVTEVASQFDIFNPYKIWLLVVFISAISFAGYILVRKVGANKGLGLTGLLGGLVSSTAVTSSLSLETKQNKNLQQAAAMGVVLACSIMFVRVIIEILVVNPDLFKASYIPFLVMAIAGFVSALLIHQKKAKHDVKLTTPFAIGPALKFALFFVFVLFAARLGQIMFGTTGIFIAAVLAGLADVDAITLSLAQLAVLGNITPEVALIGIMLATITNTLVKGGIAYFFGTRVFSRKVLLILGITILAGILSLLAVL